MLRTCTAWCAAIQAVPALWPEVELRGQDLALADVQWHDNVQQLEQTLVDEAASALGVVEQAAALDPLAWRVRLTGFKKQAGASVRHAEMTISVDCALTLHVFGIASNDLTELFLPN